MNAGFRPGFRTARGQNYGLLIFIAFVAAIIVYSGWRYGQSNENGSHEKASIAGIIIGLAILIPICLYAFLHWRRMRAARSRQMATKPRAETWREDDFRRFNGQHPGAGQYWGNGRHWGNQRHPGNQQAWGNEPYWAHNANRHGTGNAYAADVENAAADDRLPERPPPAYPGGKNDRTLRDPNPSSMLNA